MLRDSAKKELSNSLWNSSRSEKLVTCRFELLSP